MLKIRNKLLIKIILIIFLLSLCAVFACFTNISDLTAKADAVDVSVNGNKLHCTYSHNWTRNVLAGDAGGSNSGADNNISIGTTDVSGSSYFSLYLTNSFESNFVNLPGDAYIKNYGYSDLKLHLSASRADPNSGNVEVLSYFNISINLKNTSGYSLRNTTYNFGTSDSPENLAMSGGISKNFNLYSKILSGLGDGAYTLEFTYLIHFWGKSGASNCNNEINGSGSSSFKIDTVAPSGSLQTSSGETLNSGDFTNKDVKFIWDESSASASLDGGAYSSGTTISSDGFHSVALTDAAGNSSYYSFTIDKTAPEINDYPKFVNTTFSVTATDRYTGVKYWEYCKDSGQVKCKEGATLTFGGSKAANGIWTFRAVDGLGNATDWQTVVYVERETFGNSETIYNSYFQSSYYVVTLSQKNYSSFYGAYTFGEYSPALRFAVQKEWDCRVIVLDDGKSWNYVTSTNENARQIYTDRSELDKVIEKYARQNISDRKVVGKNGCAISNPTDAGGITRADALTAQLTDLPKILSGYSDCKFMLASASDKLVKPESIADGNSASATIKFISDGYSLREGPEKQLQYGETLKTSITEQGWYLIEERDLCGNVERYLIFIDLRQPTLKANVTYGNGLDELINFDQDYADANAGTMRFVGFNVTDLTDNIDEYVMISFSGRNLSATYILGDELPVLNNASGYYGAYTITVYDRSHNALEFTVYIAGDDPSLKHTSLTSENSCTFTVQTNDSFNAITDVKLFKVLFDGTEVRLDADSFGNSVSADNLVYRMNIGGKYVFEFTDLYGRTVRTNPIFYMKGLPSATLRGVKDGGITKNDVSITFDTNATAELYIYSGGEWIATSLYEISQGVSGNIVGITASPETTALYKVFLYVTDDRNLFTEYFFEIDGILPAVDIKTQSGDLLAPDTVTTQNFLITWTESGYTAFYKKQGVLSDSRYNMGTVIDAPGTYVFTFYDSVRNELTFTVTLDNCVSYTLEGAYIVMSDGSFITRNGFVFTVTEPWLSFDVNASNGLNIANGQKLDLDGTYLIKVSDLYGNKAELTLIVDKREPVPVIVAESGKVLAPGARINEPFAVFCEEAGVITTYSNGGAFSVYDGSYLSDGGAYTFKITDVIGNTAEFKIIIDKNVSYIINGQYVSDEEGNYISKSWLSVTLTEDIAVFNITSADGNSFVMDQRVTAEGEYEVYIKDLSGNDTAFKLIIDKTPPRIVLNGAEPGGTTRDMVTVGLADYAECSVIFNGDFKSAVGDGAAFNDEGSYRLSASDPVGNTVSVTFTIDRTVNVVSSLPLSPGQIITGAITFGFGEPVTASLIKDGVESVYTRGEITETGVYELRVCDAVGNEFFCRWAIVPARAREYVLKLTDANIAVLKDGAVITPVISDNVLYLTETGKYIIQFFDGAAVWELNIEVDRVAPSVDIVRTGKVIKITNPNKTSVNYTLYLNGERQTFRLNKTAEITERGSYRLICEDELGNVAEYEFELQYLGGTTIALIAAVSALIAVGVVVAVVFRLKRKIY